MYYCFVRTKESGYDFALLVNLLVTEPVFRLHAPTLLIRFAVLSRGFEHLDHVCPEEARGNGGGTIHPSVYPMWRHERA